MAINQKLFSLERHHRHHQAIDDEKQITTTKRPSPTTCPAVQKSPPTDPLNYPQISPPSASIHTTITSQPVNHHVVTITNRKIITFNLSTTQIITYLSTTQLITSHLSTTQIITFNLSTTKITNFYLSTTQIITFYLSTTQLITFNPLTDRAPTVNYEHRRQSINRPTCQHLTYMKMNKAKMRKKKNYLCIFIFLFVSTLPRLCLCSLTYILHPIKEYKYW